MTEAVQLNRPNVSQIKRNMKSVAKSFNHKNINLQI